MLFNQDMVKMQIELAGGYVERNVCALFLGYCIVRVLGIMVNISIPRYLRRGGYHLLEVNH